MVGSQTPRIEIVPDGDEHPRWDEVQDFIKALGVTLDPWQTRVLQVALMRRGPAWASFLVACCVPRQNGKNAILEVRELIGARLFGEKLQIHSAHLADTSMEGFRRLDDLIDANPWLSKDVRNIRRQNGHEQITFTDGCRIRFRTRTRGGGRGFSGSPVYYDEAMYLPDASYSAMLPVISAQPDPQVWQMGSAVDQVSMSDGIIFTRTREQALVGADRIAWLEWSLEYETPDDVPYEVMQTEEAQAQANPAFGIRITRDYIREELKTLPPRSSAVERFCVGDWPRTDGISTVFDLKIWDSLADPRSEPVGPVAYAFDVRPDRARSVIAAVGRRADGLLHIEVGEHEQGTAWLVPRLEQLERQKFPIGIVCDGLGPAASLVPELLQRNVTVRMLTTPQLGEACGMIYDAVVEGQIRHLGQPELLSAIKGAVQRTLGDRWAWNRRNSTSDISPLVAVTLGVWLVVTEEQIQIVPRFG